MTRANKIRYIAVATGMNPMVADEMFKKDSDSEIDTRFRRVLDNQKKTLDLQLTE